MTVKIEISTKETVRNLSNSNDKLQNKERVPFMSFEVEISIQQTPSKDLDVYFRTLIILFDSQTLKKGKLVQSFGLKFLLKTYRPKSRWEVLE